MRKLIGIHKHYELTNNEGQIIAEDLTLKGLAEKLGSSIRALSRGSYKGQTVYKVQYPIYDDEGIEDVTEQEKSV